MSDKGKGALAILLGGKPPPSDGAGEGDKEDLQMAAEDFIRAVKSGDAKSVADAFESMHTICDSYDEK